MLKATSFKAMTDSMAERFRAVMKSKGEAYVNDIVLKLVDVDVKDVDVLALGSGEGFQVHWLCVFLWSLILVKDPGFSSPLPFITVH